jgi:hypothetical protein
LCYTIFLRMAIPILQGRLTKANEGRAETGSDEIYPSVTPSRL